MIRTRQSPTGRTQHLFISCAMPQRLTSNRYSYAGRSSLFTGANRRIILQAALEDVPKSFAEDWQRECHRQASHFKDLMNFFGPSAPLPKFVIHGGSL